VHYPDAVRIEASSYGRPALPQPYYRPANAFDRDVRTSWRIAPVFVDEHEQWLRVVFDRPRRLDRVDVVAAGSRPTPALPDPMHATRLAAVLSDGTSVPIDLHRGRGSTALPSRPTRSLELRIDETSGTDPEPFGLAEVAIRSRGRTLDLREDVQVPDDVIRRAARSSRLRDALERAPVTYLFSRLDRLDDRRVETTLRRRFRTLGTRRYEVRGQLDAAATPADPECHDIGLVIDATPVPVHDTDGGFAGCGPITLRPGWHALGTRRAPAIRRVALATDGDTLRAPTPRPAHARLRSLGRADFAIDATTSGAAAIVSGQSADDGWAATVDGRDAGTPLALDTQAAWPIRHAGTHHLDAHQDGQGPYRIALVVTALGLVLCGWLVVRGRFP
jgi:hypothetical protein